ncbi:MAG: alpha/beta hydrolase [Deltaproteobacteria bacterium]|nr:alpha/beta hydrolase [Deltaproteobacteria bacterium]
MSNDDELWIDHRGARLFARKQGTGTPLVFLHGGLADHRASVFRLGALATTHRLITPDVRAAGRSHYAGALDWDLLTSDVVALLDALALERAVIGGISFGSAIATRFALRHGARAQALISMSPAHLGTAIGASAAMRASTARMDAAGRRAPREGIAAIRPLYEGLPTEVRAMALAMIEGFDPASVAATTRFLAGCTQPFDRLEELATLTMPVAIVPGTDDDHPAVVAESYARTIAGATVVPAGPRVVETLRGWLAQVCAPGRGAVRARASSCDR